MGGYIGPGIATQVDGYNKTQADARYPQMTGPTGAEALPTGTTAQRPSNPNTGYTRYNTDIGSIETWNGTAWVTSGGLVLQAVQTANFTAIAGNSYPVNTTSGAITLTLPASPTAGQQVNVFDYAGTATTNTITINPNGGKINGLAANAVISTVRASATLVFVDFTQGWVDVAVGNATYLPQQYSASYLIVAGGGGGGGTNNGAGEGGGGAGGLLAGTTTIYPGTTYSVTVGAGGSGTSNAATNGANSVFSAVTVTGGGHGGCSGGPLATSGGSGGGANYNGSGASGTVGQGYAGGSGYNGGSYGGGGGGGSASVGGNGSGSSGGNGGSGTSSSITGSAVTYAGGGGGGIRSGGTAGTGQGGGGDGAVGNANGSNATANTGGGGGGAAQSGATVNGGNGGSGVVILSVPTANYSGTTTGSPTVTTSGSNTIIKFTSSGSYTA